MFLNLFSAGFACHPSGSSQHPTALHRMETMATVTDTTYLPFLERLVNPFSDRLNSGRGMPRPGPKSGVPPSVPQRSPVYCRGGIPAWKMESQAPRMP